MAQTVWSPRDFIRSVLWRIGKKEQREELEELGEIQMRGESFSTGIGRKGFV